MLRKKISVLLAVAMAAGLAAGCGSSGGSTVESSVNESSAGTQAESVQESNAGQESADGEKELSAQEPYTVRIVADGYGSEEACAEISAAVSEITKAKFNTEVEIVRYDFSTYVDKVQTELALSLIHI